MPSGQGHPGLVKSWKKVYRKFLCSCQHNAGPVYNLDNTSSECHTTRDKLVLPLVDVFHFDDGQCYKDDRISHNERGKSGRDRWPINNFAVLRTKKDEGLRKTGPGTGLRVVKNLQMPHDITLLPMNPLLVPEFGLLDACRSGFRLKSYGRSRA